MKIEKKAVIAGNVIEFYEYQKPIIKGYKSKSPGRSSEGATDEQKLANRAKVQQKAKKTLRGLINANVGQYMDEEGKPYKPVFMTLTYAENMQDIKLANYQFMKFIQRLNTLIYGRKAKANLKYVVVTEFQQRGAIHFHLVVFNMPYIEANEIGRIWGNGFIKVNGIDEVDNIGSYVTKYMGKDLEADKLQGLKCYRSSKGLQQPTVIEDKEKVEQLVATLHSDNLVYSANFENEYTGNINYQQYNIGQLNRKYRG